MVRFILAFSTFMCLSVSGLANVSQLPPISMTIQAYSLESFYKNGEAVYKYLDEMLIGKHQAGHIDWVFQNYRSNLRLGAIDGTFTNNDFPRLTFEKLNESMGFLYRINSEYKQQASTNYEVDHALNLIKIGFLHAVLVMRINALTSIDAYNQILNSLQHGFIYPLGHSSGANDPDRSILVLNLLLAYSIDFPIDHLEQLANDVMVNLQRVENPERKRILWELVQNLAYYGAKNGVAPSRVFGISELDYRFRLANLALFISENNKFQYSQRTETLSLYRHIAQSKGFVREAKKTYLKELWLGGPFEKPVITILLVLGLYGVWLLSLGSILSVGYRKWKARGHQSIGIQGKGFGRLLNYLKKSLGFLGQISGGALKEIFYCLYKNEVRKKYTIELAILMFSLSWILNDYLSELQVLVAN